MLRIHRRGDMKYSIYRALALATFALAVQGKITKVHIYEINHMYKNRGTEKTVEIVQKDT